jgi:TRAP-type C4-dicarboxylate transport system substrate-binding protein
MRRVSIAGIVLLVVMIASLIAACTPEAETTTPPPANGGATTPPPANGGAPAAQTITLSFATFESEAHYRIPVMNWFAEELDKRTGGKTETTVFVAGALGSPFDILDNIESGVADMGYVYMGLVAGHNPIFDIVDMPLLIPTPGAAQYVAWELYNRGFLDVEGTKVLQFAGMEPLKLYTADKKATTVEDLNGLVIHVGASHVPFCEKVGISPVLLDHPDIYPSVEKGVVDGGIAGIGLPKAMKMEGILKYIIWNEFGGAGVHPCLINQAKWDSLPDDVKVIMLELSRETDSKLTEAAYKEIGVCYDYFNAAGVEIYSLSPEEWNKILALTESLPGDWAAEMDAQGVPATQAMEVVMQSLEALGVK